MFATASMVRTHTIRLSFLPLLWLSFWACANTKTELETIIPRMFFGERSPIDSCGDGGRLLTEKELTNIRQELCENILTSPWDTWKLAKSDGGLLYLMGNGYGCTLTTDADPWSRSLCISRDSAPNDSALLFASDHYFGIGTMRGEPTVRRADEDDSNTHIRSFILNDSVYLVAWPNPHFHGEAQIFSHSVPQLPYTIRSYRLHRNHDNRLSITYQSPAANSPSTCLMLKLEQQQHLRCSSQADDGPLIFQSMARSHQRQNLSFYLYSETSKGQVRASEGQLSLIHTGKGGFYVDYDQSSLPAGLFLSQHGNQLTFRYQP